MDDPTDFLEDELALIGDDRKIVESNRENGEDNHPTQNQHMPASKIRGTTSKMDREKREREDEVK